MAFGVLIKNKQNILYGLSLALLLLLLKWLEWRFIIIHHAFEIYYGPGYMACQKTDNPKSKNGGN
jgi:NarL family two-component system response regulator LiaR